MLATINVSHVCLMEKELVEEKNTLYSRQLKFILCRPKLSNQKLWPKWTWKQHRKYIADIRFVILPHLLSFWTISCYNYSERLSAIITPSKGSFYVSEPVLKLRKCETIFHWWVLWLWWWHLDYDTVTDVQLSRSHGDSDVCWEGHSQRHQLINGSSRQSNKHKALS